MIGRKKTVLITGGAGFIGINTADHYIKKGYRVIILDNLSRQGVDKNIHWLKKVYPGKFELLKHDIRKDNEKFREAIGRADIIFHFAGQVAVTTSIHNPREDFEINALGTINLLEAIRKSRKNPILIFSSTNKVYGNLDTIPFKETKTRYVFKKLPYGVDENISLDFHSPYGCSKGAADQYIRDYSRIYGIRAVVFRQSCIYGPHQYGFEDQGWVAWFMIAGLLNKKLTIYGNGKQVRDLLHVQDLVNAYELAIENIDKTQGKIYNIGGGLSNSISIWLEFGPMLEKLYGKTIKTKSAKQRPGDQSIFIADIRKAKKDFGWKPKISLQKGLAQMYNWVLENEKNFA